MDHNQWIEKARERGWRCRIQWDATEFASQPGKPWHNITCWALWNDKGVYVGSVVLREVESMGTRDREDKRDIDGTLVFMSSPTIDVDIDLDFMEDTEELRQEGLFCKDYGKVMMTEIEEDAHEAEK